MLDDIRVTNDLDGPYIVGGTRAYLIGQMDGTFPSYGEHIPGEMAGLWRHPNKLLREIRIGWAAPGLEPRWLEEADAFVRKAWAVEHEYCVHKELRLTRTFWVPDDEPGLVMEIEVKNASDHKVRLDLLVGWTSDLHPGWLDDTPRGQDSAQVTDMGWLFGNSAASWWVSCASDTPCDTHLRHFGMANDPPPECAAATTVHHLTVPASGHTRIIYWICGGDDKRPWVTFPEELDHWRHAKEARYHELLATAAISIPDPLLAQSLEWMKPQMDWLIRAVPGIGTGIGAGVPEYPWWFACDSHYAVKGALAFGQHVWAQDTLTLLKDISQRTNGNGRMIHEVSTTGVVYHIGNAQEAPQFVGAVWETFCWSGDMGWLRSMYEAVAAAMQWVLDQDDSGRDLAVGYGIIEIDALNLRMLDTAVYTYVGLKSYACIAGVMEDHDLSRQLMERADRLKKRILALFWLADEGLFADFLGFSGDVKKRVPVWMDRANNRGQPEAAARYNQLPCAPRERGEAAYLMKNWIINTPMEVGMAPESWAQRALTIMRTSPEFHGPYGLYLSGVDQREMMTISTGVQAVAEIRYGNANAALQWMHDIAKTMNRRSPGTISEMSPDYGCFVQAWTAYGLWYPLVTGFFGIRPNAWQRELQFQPTMPDDWDHASIRRVKVGSNHLRCEYERRGASQWYRLGTEEPWDISFGSNLDLCDLGAGELVDSGHVALKSGGYAIFQKAAGKQETS